MSGYLIYHPRRDISYFKSTKVYHDSNCGNQDPYIWNQKFLHTYCHITQMSPQIDYINFWVSGDCFPEFSFLYCDLVFLVAEKLYWQNANNIDDNNPVVDSDRAYNDHYRWHFQHFLKRRRRFTLKADPESSFQPQNARQELIDVLPFLLDRGFSLTQLRKNLRSGFSSKPMPLSSSIAAEFYSWISQRANIKLYGFQLEEIRKQNQHLASL